MTETTQDQLEAEIEALRAQLAEKDQTIGRLRTRAWGYERLLTRAERRVAEIQPREGARPHVRFLNGEDEAEEASGALQALLSTDEAQARQDHALASGCVVEYEDVGRERVADEHAGPAEEAAAPAKRWRITLVPAPASKADRLIATARDVTDERDVAEELRSTEQLYHRLVEVLADPVIITDAEGTLLYVNAAGADMLGALSAGPLVGEPVWRFLDPAEREAVRGRYQGFMAREEPVAFGEYALKRLDGEWVPVETASVPVQYQGRAAVLTTARDLRGRREMAEALSETLDLFYNVYQIGPTALAISRVADHVFLEVNEQFLRLTGYAREEVVGASREQIDLWVSASERRAFLATLGRHGAVRDFEARIRRKSGEVRTHLISAQLVDVRGEACVLLSGLDITERRRSALAERESQALFREVFRASPAGISITRFEDGHILDANEAFCHLTGYRREELIGRTTQALGLWAQSEQRAELMASLQSEQGALRDYEADLRTKSGEVRTGLFSFQRIQVEGKACLLSVGVDITNRKEAERALLDARQRAEEMARFRTGLLTNMTHEVRTPLTVILGFSSMLRQGVRPSHRRFVDLIERSGRRLLLTLDSVLDLAQLEAGMLQVERRPYNVVDIAYTAVEAFRPIAAEKELALRFDLPRHGVYARTDYEIVTRVLNHLLDNAVKFTEAGRVEVTISTEAEQQVAISIADTGIGIGEDFLPRLFDAFSQESTGLERTYQGTGLGLAVSKRLIEQIGGHLRVSSRKGEGSTFTVVLPKAAGASIAA